MVSSAPLVIVNRRNLRLGSFCRGLVCGALSGALAVASLPALSGYGDRYCTREGFTCLTASRGDRWQTLFPDPDRRDLAQRLNRTNVRLRDGQKIAVPVDWTRTGYRDLAPFPPDIGRLDTNRLVIEQSELAWAAYDRSGRLLKWGPLSGGKSYCRDLGRGCRTRPGRFTVYRAEGAGCVSRKFPLGRGGAKMPYCMFYHGGYAVHGSYEVPGHHASHGCVRVFVQDAEWLYRHFVRVGETQVWIDQGETSLVPSTASDPVVEGEGCR
jgi:hypothetical protein